MASCLGSQGCLAVIAASALEADRQEGIGAERRRAVYETYAENVEALDAADRVICHPDRAGVFSLYVRGARARNQELFDQGNPLAMNQYSYAMRAELDRLARACVLGEASGVAP